MEKYAQFLILPYYVNILINYIKNRLYNIKYYFFAKFKQKVRGTLNVLLKLIQIYE